MPKAKKQMPRVVAREVSLWGEYTEAELQDPETDIFEVKGYSDKRRRWEEAYQEWEAGGRHGKPPAPLNHRFQYVSVLRANGTPDGRKAAEYRQKGYRPVKWAEAKSLGIVLEDENGDYLTAARPGEDGNVYVQSQMLFVADAPTAAREAKRVLTKQDDNLEAIETRLNDSAERWNAKMGLSSRGGTAFELADETPEA